MNIRTIKVWKLPLDRNHGTKDNTFFVGNFHGFATIADESGSEVVAIVERPDGTIAEVSTHYIQFANPLSES